MLLEWQYARARRAKEWFVVDNKLDSLRDLCNALDTDQTLKEVEIKKKRQVHGRRSERLQVRERLRTILKEFWGRRLLLRSIGNLPLRSPNDLFGMQSPNSQ